MPCGCCAENFLEYRHDLYGKGIRLMLNSPPVSRTKAYSLKRGDETSSSSFSGLSVVHEEINQRKLIKKCFEQFSVLLLGVHNTVEPL